MTRIVLWWSAFTALTGAVSSYPLNRPTPPMVGNQTRNLSFELRSMSSKSPSRSPNSADTRLSKFLGSGRITGKPHLTTSCSDRSHLAASDSGASGSIMLQPAQALSLSDQRRHADTTGNNDPNILRSSRATRSSLKRDAVPEPSQHHRKGREYPLVLEAKEKAAANLNFAAASLLFCHSAP